MSGWNTLNITTWCMPTWVTLPTLQIKVVKAQGYTMTQAVKVYTLNGTILVTLLSLFFFLAAQTDRQIADWWIRIWVSGGYHGYERWALLLACNLPRNTAHYWTCW
jgi:hypothetical protein